MLITDLSPHPTSSSEMMTMLNELVSDSPGAQYIGTGDQHYDLDNAATHLSAQRNQGVAVVFATHTV
jgi:hypothetical protein